MLGVLWDLHQQGRIRDLETRLASDARAGSGTERGLIETAERVDALVLLNMAMWSILEEKLGVTEAELVQRIERIDLEDGKLDGRRAPPPTVCGGCGRTVAGRHRHCIYCGGQLAPRGPFGRV